MLFKPRKEEKCMKKLRMLSLFAGIGGCDIAAEKTGLIETVGFCEYEKPRWGVLKKHFPNVPDNGFYKDIFDLNKNLLEEDGIINDKNGIDVIAGGPPCQPFSNAGKQEGVEDERHLTPEMLRLITELQPKFVVLENVPPFRKVLGAGDAYIREMAERGYISKSVCVPADLITNAPHKRERFYCVSIQMEYASKIRWELIEEKCNNKIKRNASLEIWNGELIASNRIPELIKINGEWLMNPEFSGWLMGFPRGWNERDTDNKKVNKLRLEEFGNSVVPQAMEPLFQFIVDCYKSVDCQKSAA